ncbi:MAG: hypothetical protein WCC86_03145 [Methanoregula sp.]|uniref:hypothetical protein n=1 Tax=Methanoregula sp. TaxID=2052170 RepID=UPI003BAF9542
MEGHEEAQFLSELFGEPSLFEKLNKSIRRLFTSRSEITYMRNHLINEYKLPFIEHIKPDSLDFEDSWSKHMFIDHFEERLKTLPDDVIIALYGIYVKAKTMKNQKERDDVNRRIVHLLELSYSLDGWFNVEKMGAQNRKKRF